MSHKRPPRLLPLGLALGLLACGACSVGDDAAHSSGPPSEEGGPSPSSQLSRLPAVDVDGDPFKELNEADSSQGVARKPVAVARLGSQGTLVAYTERGTSCGVLTHGQEVPRLSLSAKPGSGPSKDGSGLPFGPYGRTSGAASGDPDFWASLHCGPNGLVIELSPQAADDIGKVQGEASLISGSGKRNSHLVIGPSEMRDKVRESVTDSLTTG